MTTMQPLFWSKRQRENWVSIQDISTSLPFLKLVKSRSAGLGWWKPCRLDCCQWWRHWNFQGPITHYLHQLNGSGHWCQPCRAAKLRAEREMEEAHNAHNVHERRARIALQRASTVSVIGQIGFWRKISPSKLRSCWWNSYPRLDSQIRQFEVEIRVGNH